MKAILTLALTALVSLGICAADPPPVMNHQGRIAVSGVNLNGTGHFKFLLIDGAASQTFWTSDGSGIGPGVAEPASATAIPVAQGHYSVLLGAAPMPALPADAFSNQADLRLRIWFSETVGGPFELLSPDRRITPAGYAFSATRAGSLAPSYESGSGAQFALTSIGGGGELVVAASYTQEFANAPAPVLGAGWNLDASDETGFTTRAGFVPRVVDPGGTVGSYTSLALIGGRPAISYRDEGEGDLLFVRAADASGTSWPSSAIVRVAGLGSDDVGQYSSLAEVAGRPAIAYYDAGAGDLKFIRASNAAGTAWPSTAITVDGTGGNVGRYCSLAVIAGVPAISYTSPNSGEVLYAWASDADGATWPAANRVALEGSLGDYRQESSLAEVNGGPALATYNTTSGDLRYLYLSGADPANPGDWTAVDAATAGNVGRAPSLAVIGNLPAISFDDTSGSLRFVRATDAAGAGWDSPVLVSSSGAGSALVEVGGRPALGFYDPALGDLKFAWAGDATGTTWPPSNQIAVDAGPSVVGTHASIAIVDGLPALVYRDESAASLKYAALPLAEWTASTGGAEPILASGVKDGGVRGSMLSADLGVWAKSGDDLFHDQGRVGIGRLASKNALEVEGNASKTTAGSWLANSDGRIKTKVREIENPLARIRALRLVDFEYSDAYRNAHPSIEVGRRYPNVIAQEFAEVFPEWVSASGERLPDGSDHILQVDTYPLTVYSAAAIQELAAENVSLRERVAKLEAALERLLEKE